MDTFDCYAIADSLLAGNQAARWVLVDWLCDVGDYDEANFIRRTSASRAGDLNIAIRQVPAPQVVQLGCDFIEHCVDSTQTSLYSLLGRVRRLLHRGGSAERYTAAACVLDEFRTMERDWYEAFRLRRIDEAVQCLRDAVIIAALPGDAPRAAAIAVTSTARSLRGTIFGGFRAKKQPDQLAWQIKRTRLLLGQLAIHGCTQ